MRIINTIIPLLSLLFVFAAGFVAGFVAGRVVESLIEKAHRKKTLKITGGSDEKKAGKTGLDSTASSEAEKKETPDFSSESSQKAGASAHSSFNVLSLNRAGICNMCGNTASELFSITLTTAAGEKQETLCSDCAHKFVQDYSFSIH